MNILHLKYMVSIAECGSINRAAEELHVAQPNLSRVVREMEADLGIRFFLRSSRGMVLTPDGELFVARAKKILEQADEMEAMFRRGGPPRQRFSISVPAAGYISEAFAVFSRGLDGKETEIYYQETNTAQAVKNILEAGYDLGMIRYAARHDKYFKSMLDEKGLRYELAAEFRHVLAMRQDSPLADREVIRCADLADLIRISLADPSLPLSAAGEDDMPRSDRRICVFERGSTLDLLSCNPDTYMWVSPMPERLLKSLGLVQRECADSVPVYRDMLISRADYRLTELDKRFITELTCVKRECMALVKRGNAAAPTKPPV